MQITLGVISDTHMPHMAKALPRALVAGLQNHGVDVLVHCGDVTTESVIPLFEAVAPFEAVAGNNDSPALVERFGRKKILGFGGVRIGLVHGHEGRSGLKTPERALRQFHSDHVQAVLFGHSHMPLNETRDGVLLLNPGSPTDKRRNERYSYGIVRIVDSHLDAEICYYADKSP